MAFYPYNPKSLIEYIESMKNYLIDNSSGLSNFQKGSRILALIEAISLELAQSDLETFRGFKSTILEGLYSIFGFERKPGNKATGIINIENTGHTSALTYPVFKIDLFGIQFETIQEITMGIGIESVQVGIRAVEPGQDGNIKLLEIDTDQGKGTVLNTIPEFTRIWNPSDLINGTDQESDQDRLSRFRAYINSFGKSTPLGIYSKALSISGVLDCSVVNNINPVSGLAETGWVLVYITDGTVEPPQILLDEVYKQIKGDENDPENYPGVLAAGVTLYVSKMEVAEIDISYSLVLKSSSLLTDTEAKTIAESRAYLYINNLPAGEDVLFETLKSYMLTGSDDFYIINISNPSGDLVIQPGYSAKIRSIACTDTTLSRVIPV